MTAQKNRPQISKSLPLPGFQTSDDAPRNSINGNFSYKGGRILRCATRFELWRSTEKLSLARITSRLFDRVSKFGISEQQLGKALWRFEEGKHQPPTWLVLALMQTYQIEFPWEDFVG